MDVYLIILLAAVLAVALFIADLSFAGGVVGAVVLVLITMLVIRWSDRRNKRKL